MLQLGAPGSTNDARLLKESLIYTTIWDEGIMPDKVIQICSKLFQVIPQYVCLLKMYNENTRDKQKKKYYSKKLRGARAVMKNV